MCFQDLESSARITAVTRFADQDSRAMLAGILIIGT